jgi:formylglycine-generating enzyme required for sulfatase activity
MMQVLRPIVPLLLVALASGCPKRSDFIECRDNGSCRLAEGGECRENAATGHQFCSYPDEACESGMRWSDVDVEDSIAGMCVVPEVPIDGGVDAPIDAEIPDAEPGPPEFASCEGLASTCGPSANADCCSTNAVTGGTFYRSYDAAPDAHNDMGYPATVSDFRLDTYEVTVGRFRRFITEGPSTQSNPPGGGAGEHAAIVGSGWQSSWNINLKTDQAALITAIKCSTTYQTWTDEPGDNENKPINCVSWYEAFAFCAWDGGYLPTEAEWNYAATGGDEQRAYPWSNPATSTVIDCSHANYRINNPVGTYCVNGTTGAANRVGSESTTGDGRYGQADLAGNIAEWVLDAYATYTNPCNDCANLTEGNRAIRGGSFAFTAPSERTADRLNQSGAQRTASLGFRCARPAP